MSVLNSRLRRKSCLKNQFRTVVSDTPLHKRGGHKRDSDFFERSATTLQLGGAIVALTAGGDVNFKLTFLGDRHVELGFDLSTPAEVRRRSFVAGLEVTCEMLTVDETARGRNLVDGKIRLGK